MDWSERLKNGPDWWMDPQGERIERLQHSSLWPQKRDTCYPWYRYFDDGVVVTVSADLQGINGKMPSFLLIP